MQIWFNLKNKDMVFFIVEKNDLNGQYVVYSRCEQLVQCYAFDSRKMADDACSRLNEKANNDYIKYKPNITWDN